MVFGDIAGVLSAGIWGYLLMGRGGYWRVKESRRRAGGRSGAAPRVTAIVPARDEAACIARCITSLLSQTYRGSLEIVVVDDGSTDGTAETARDAAQAIGAAGRLTVLRAPPLLPGWSGKLWAIHNGIAHAEHCDFLLLTDADIEYDRNAVSDLVARAQTGGYVLTSIMAQLRCRDLAERAFVPAFVFFFQMLYPFAWVNRPGSATAAAAGGCMLVRPDVLTRSGGIAAIRHALIDDCTLARQMKKFGPIYLALDSRVRSVRPYPRIGDFRRMVARTAYTELGHSPAVLAAMTAAMCATFLVPPLLTLFADGTARLLGAAAWLAMAAAYQPMLAFYRVSALWGLALPAIAAFYLLWTFDSAAAYIRGEGGMWKGRVQAGAQ